MTQKQLPERLINQKKRSQLQAEFERSLRAAQSAYEALRNVEDLGKIPDDPKRITTKWLNRVLLEKVGRVEDLPIPATKKNDILESWDKIRKEARQHITSIQSFFESFGNVQYEIKDGVITINNEDAILDDASMMIVPKDAQKHYILWCIVRDAIDALRTWERERNLKKFPLDQIVGSGVDPCLFAECWCNGTFQKNEYEKSAKAEQLRAINESMYL